MTGRGEGGGALRRDHHPLPLPAAAKGEPPTEEPGVSVHHLAHLADQLDAGEADGDVDALGKQDHLLQNLGERRVVLSEEQNKPNQRGPARGNGSRPPPPPSVSSPGRFWDSYGSTLLAMAAMMKRTASVTSQDGLPSFSVEYNCRQTAGCQNGGLQKGPNDRGGGRPGGT